MSCNHLLRGSITYHPDDTQYGNRIAYRIFSQDILSVILLVVLALVGAGCTEQSTPYRPPTIAVQATRPALATVTPTATVQIVETTVAPPTPSCTSNLTFLEDLSLPDGSVVKPGESLDKRWLVENSGSCNWDERYRLKFTSGVDLSAPIDQALYPARSGAKATIRILFTAPTEAGTYQSGWQAYDPQGQPFGDPIYIQVVVSANLP